MTDNSNNKIWEQDYISLLRMERERLQKENESLENRIKSLEGKCQKLESDVKFQTEAALRCYDALKELSEMSFPTTFDICEKLADCEDLIKVEYDD